MREMTFGMSALRSPVYPQVMVIIGVLADWAGVKVNPYVLWRTSHVVWTSLLPLAVHAFSHQLTKSRDISCVTSLVVVTCELVTSVGTHTLINSFLSPVVFFLLTLILATFEDFTE